MNKIHVVIDVRTIMELLTSVVEQQFHYEKPLTAQIAFYWLLCRADSVMGVTVTNNMEYLPNIKADQLQRIIGGEIADSLVYRVFAMIPPAQRGSTARVVRRADLTNLLLQYDNKE